MSRKRKKSSMQDIADILGISKNAVSLAINDKEGISESLKAKIIETAEEIGYLKSSQTKKESDNLLWIMDGECDCEGGFYAPLISAVLRYAKEKGYNMQIVNINRKVQQKNLIPNEYYEIKAVGVLFLGIFEAEYLRQFLMMKIPSVMMVHHHYGVALSHVLSANLDAGYMVTKYLIDKRHSKIGFLAEIGMFDTFRQRRNGYRQALSDAGIDYKTEYEIVDEGADGEVTDYVEQRVKRICRMDDPPTAWVCGNDYLAIALMGAMWKEGKKIPEDISIVGIDGIEAAGLVHPKLCTYEVGIEQLGRRSVDALLQKISGGDGVSPEIWNILGKLQEGESVKTL